MSDDHVTHARTAEARAAAARDDDERRLYLDIARAWRELAQMSAYTPTSETRGVAQKA